MSEQGKVYCIDCEYLVAVDRNIETGQCAHSNNWTSNWRTPLAKQIKGAEEINKDNDCKWFKKIDDVENGFRRRRGW
jgi:hypothetical protein